MAGQKLQPVGSLPQRSGVCLAGPAGSLAAHGEADRGALAGVGFTEVSAGTKLLNQCSGRFPLEIEMLFYGLINGSGVFMELYFF